MPRERDPLALAGHYLAMADAALENAVEAMKHGTIDECKRYLSERDRFAHKAEAYLAEHRQRQP